MSKNITGGIRAKPNFPVKAETSLKTHAGRMSVEQLEGFLTNHLFKK